MWKDTQLSSPSTGKQASEMCPARLPEPVGSQLGHSVSGAGMDLDGLLVGSAHRNRNAAGPSRGVMQSLDHSP